ncbi:Fis family transcriptional regulator [Desulfofundulus thermocisternus]|uniref:Fis family transcriptional regulator n=1 Tax=Desulfofundulus thermocisternus TaxID=42471 RepID=UPI00217DE310|nr:Fis family transcriptional regulator [Desulfofundulus thermocisternus]MCS5696558.1 Fis family transcriptional regulator [Desulfofundulus thermocisternus]
MKRKVAVIIAVAFAAVALLSGVALAQTTQNQSGTPAPFQAFLEKLAANLGVGQDTLKEAIKQTELQMIDEAVQQGKMTSDQAAKIKERLQNDPWAFGRFFGHRVSRGPDITLLAQALGMSKDELKAQLEEGKKIDDIAKEQGITIDQLREKMREAKTQAIQQAVKEGKISQDEADKLIQRLQNAPQDRGFRHFGPPASNEQ